MSAHGAHLHPVSSDGALVEVRVVVSAVDVHFAGICQARSPQHYLLHDFTLKTAVFEKLSVCRVAVKEVIFTLVDHLQRAVCARPDLINTFQVRVGVNCPVQLKCAGVNSGQKP